MACEMALEATHRLDAALALGFPAGEIGAGGGVQSPSRDRNDAQCAVELAVAAMIETMTVLSPREHRDRRDSGDPCKVRVADEALSSAVCPIKIAAQSGPQPVWSDLPRSRSPRRETPISFGATLSTRSPAATSACSR